MPVTVKLFGPTVATVPTTPDPLPLPPKYPEPPLLFPKFPEPPNGRPAAGPIDRTVQNSPLDSNWTMPRQPTTRPRSAPVLRPRPRPPRRCGEYGKDHRERALEASVPPAIQPRHTREVAPVQVEEQIPAPARRHTQVTRSVPPSGPRRSAAALLIEAPPGLARCRRVRPGPLVWSGCPQRQLCPVVVERIIQVAQVVTTEKFGRKDQEYARAHENHRIGQRRKDARSILGPRPRSPRCRSSSWSSSHPWPALQRTRPGCSSPPTTLEG